MNIYEYSESQCVLSLLLSSVHVSGFIQTLTLASFVYLAKTFIGTYMHIIACMLAPLYLFSSCPINRHSCQYIWH